MIMPSESAMSFESRNDEMFRANAHRLMRELLPQVVPARPIPILDWIEKHFTYPTGPSRGQPYSRKDQPATSLFLSMLDDPRWLSAMLVAPNQAGKSLSLVQFVLNVQFNWREDVILGMPDLDKMWNAKWHKDFVPAISASALKGQLPTTGRGSAGGTPSLVQWKNGQTMTVMGAGAGDSQRAGSTARVVAVTEMKDFGDAAAGSDEGAKIDQLTRRTLSFMGRELILGESTVTTSKNIAWNWFLAGTQSMPFFPCESCEEHIAPEREHLVGWQDARTEEEAREKSMFSCPCCGVLIDDAKRRRLLQEAVVLHKGQAVDRGRVVGDAPPTRKLSYRFTASTNMLADSGSIGVLEWEHHHEQAMKRRLELHREITQKIYAIPSDGFGYGIDPLDGNTLMTRVLAPEFGIVPAGSDRLWGGVDVRKTAMHWTVISSGPGGASRVIAWGEERILQDIPLEQAILTAGRQLQDRFRNGFQVEGSHELLPVTLTLMDSGWKDQYVFAACDLDDFWLPLKGFGAGVLKKEKYKAPTRKSTTVRFIGDGFDVKFLDGRWVVHSDSSEFKSRLHAALRMDVSSPNAMVFAESSQGQLRQLISHLTAEVEVVSQDAGQSTSVWEEKSDQNHLLDSTSYANLARCVWKFIQDMIQPPEEDHGGYTVSGEGPLFG